jgi:hypothetical protein
LGDALRTCTAEVAHHHGQLCLESTGTPVGTRATFRHLVFQVDGTLAEVRATAKAALEAADDAPSWAVGGDARAAGMDGVRYPSVRLARGRCLAVFEDRALRFDHVEVGLIVLEWDGARSIPI